MVGLAEVRAVAVTLPRTSEHQIRVHWVRGRLAALDEEELRELVIDAWRMCVPKKVAAARLGL